MNIIIGRCSLFFVEQLLGAYYFVAVSANEWERAQSRGRGSMKSFNGGYQQYICDMVFTSEELFGELKSGEFNGRAFLSCRMIGNWLKYPILGIKMIHQLLGSGCSRSKRHAMHIPPQISSILWDFFSFTFSCLQLPIRTISNLRAKLKKPEKKPKPFSFYTSFQKSYVKKSA